MRTVRAGGAVAGATATGTGTGTGAGATVAAGSDCGGETTATGAGIEEAAATAGSSFNDGRSGVMAHAPSSISAPNMHRRYVDMRPPEVFWTRHATLRRNGGVKRGRAAISAPPFGRLFRDDHRMHRRQFRQQLVLRAERHIVLV